MYLSCAVPNVQSNKQNGDVLWLRMETNGVGKRDSVLSKIIKIIMENTIFESFLPKCSLSAKKYHEIKLLPKFVSNSR